MPCCRHGRFHVSVRDCMLIFGYPQYGCDPSFPVLYDDVYDFASWDEGVESAAYCTCSYGPSWFGASLDTGPPPVPYSETIYYSEGVFPGGCHYECSLDAWWDYCEVEWTEPGVLNHLCGTVGCCFECAAPGVHRCTQRNSAKHCEDDTAYGDAFCANQGSYLVDHYPIPDEFCGGDHNMCGRTAPCCLPNGQCALRTYGQCKREGGTPSGPCVNSCLDAPNCCPPPVPCCTCGECHMNSEQNCAEDLGVVPLIPGDQNCGNPNALAECERMDRLRRPCRFGVMLPAPTVRVAFDGHFDLHTVAPLENIEPYVDPPKHYRGQVWDRPWMCHDSHKRPERRMIENMGFAVQGADMKLGACVPVGHGAFILPYRTACELLSQKP